MNRIVQKHHWGWYAALILALGAAAAFLFWAGWKLDYQWHWSHIPEFFVTQSAESTVAPLNGQVVAIHGGTLTLKDLTGELHSILLPNTDSVTVGQEVFEGDVLALNTRWRLGPLTEGVWVTLWMSTLAGLFGFLLSIAIAFMHLSKNPLQHGLATVYVEVIRGTPLIVQLFIAYFFVGTVLHLDKYTAGLAALSLFAAAYFSEILRAGIASIPFGQIEAARALGLSAWQTAYHLTLPMGIKRSLPGLTGQLINIVKDSSLLSIIAVSDLSKAAREIAASTFASFEVWFTVAILYLMITLSLGKLSRTLERR